MQQILGKWQTDCWKVNMPGGWKTLQQFAPGQVVWDFQPDNTLLEQVENEAPEQLIYHYDPEKLLLTVQRFGAEERYRVEFTPDNRLILYDLESIEIEPDDYTLRVEMERVLQNPEK